MSATTLPFPGLPMLTLASLACLPLVLFGPSASASAAPLNATAAEPDSGAEARLATPAAAPTPRPTPQRYRPASPPPPAERDGDGDSHFNHALGGDDCDDGDANRFPGNPEVCDAAHHDEDCNPLTYGERDADRDGHPDARCCNRQPGRGLACGTDCDDTNAAVHPDAQACSRGAQADFFASPEGPPWDRVPCGAGTRCAAQPNGTGVCVP
jgi:hypothetical protein